MGSISVSKVQNDLILNILVGKLGKMKHHNLDFDVSVFCLRDIKSKKMVHDRYHDLLRFGPVSMDNFHIFPCARSQ